MNRTDTHTGPPRLLLGIAFLYWGAVVGHPLVGLLCAFLVEARWWVDLRWEFGEAGFSRAWRLSLLLMMLIGLALWLLGESVLGLFDLLIWLPVLYLPVLLAQQYSVEGCMPLNTFSYVAKRKMQFDRAAGREVKPLLVHVGYGYFCLILIGAGLGRPSLAVSFVAAVVLGAIALWFASPLGRQRPVSWLLAMSVALVVSLGGVVGVKGMFDFLQDGNLGLAAGDRIGDEAHTAIGMIGEIKQSHRIRWRVRTGEPVESRLFKTAGFNRYGNGVWSHRPPPPFTFRDEDYEEMVTAGGVEGDELERFAFVREDLLEQRDWPSSYMVRGAVHPSRPTPIPLASGAGVLSGVEADLVSFNSLGTVRVENPDRGVVDFTVSEDRSAGSAAYEDPPYQIFDLHVPPSEMPGLQRVCDSLGLAELEDEKKIAALRQFFAEKFEYSLILNNETLGGSGSEEAITGFLEVSRVGHCEYFGTAGALLLRQAGVPARYCEGFGAQEWDGERREWVLRGIHAHAWCRAYIGGRPERQVGEDGVVGTVWTGGRWVDVDLTPPGWLGLEQQGAGTPVLVHLIDWWQRLREDFLIWRTRPANRALVRMVIIVVGVLLLVYVVRRLWKHRRRGGGPAAAVAGGAEALVTPLHGLERSAGAVLGPRSPGESLTRWLLGLDRFLPGQEQELRRAVALHWKARFDPLGVEDGEREQLAEDCSRLRKSIRGLPRRTA